LAYDPNLPSLAQLMGGAAAPAPPQRDSLGAILASNAQSAWGNFRYGLPAAIEATTGTMTPEDERYYVAWNRHHQEQAQQTAPEGAADIDDYMAGRVGLGRAFLENVTAMVPHAATAIAGGIAGTIAAPGPGTLAGAAGGLVGSAVQFTGSNAGRAMEETGGLTREQGARSIMLAPAQAPGLSPALVGSWDRSQPSSKATLSAAPSRARYRVRLPRQPLRPVSNSRSAQR
jgi:hypothetical protein